MATTNPLVSNGTTPPKPRPEEIKSFLQANITNAGAIKNAMEQYGVGFDDIKAAGNYTNQQMDEWMGSYGNGALKSQWETYKSPPPPPAAPPPPPPVAPVTSTPNATPAGTSTNAPATTDSDKWMSILEKALETRGGPAAPPAATPTASPPPAAPAPSAPMSASAPPPQQVTFGGGMSAADRLNQMLSQDGPLMQRARQRGLLTANSRGVLNTSEAANAAQRAMIDAAAPIATSDAAANTQTAISNMQEANRYTTSGLDRDLGYAKLNQDDRQFDKTLDLNYAQLSENARQANMGTAAQMSIAGMNYNINDRRLNQEDRQFLSQFALEQRKLDTQISQFAQQFGLSAQELELKKGQLSQQDRQFYDELKMEERRLNQQAEQFTKEWENKFSLESMAQANRIDLAKIDANNRKELMAIEAQYKQDIAGNENISNAWGLMMQEIGKINANPDMDAATKATNISNVIGGFKNFTGFWKKVSGGTIDVSDLLDFQMDLPEEDGPTRDSGVPAEAPGGGSGE